MNLAGWRFLVFALCGTGAIVLLATIGMPGRKDVSFDRHTGERVIVVRTLGDALFAARDQGSARGALDALRKLHEQFGEDPVLQRTEAMLEAELGAREAAPPPRHERAAAVAAEIARAARAQEDLLRRSNDLLPRESLLPLLAELDADEAIAEESEKFFAPLARWAERHRPSAERCDELAVRALARLAAHEGVDDPATYLAVANAYRSQNRPRARRRWLLRAYGALPEGPAVRDPLLACYLEEGRLLEALCLLGTALASDRDNFELWRERAKLAGWCSLPRVEATSREELLRERDDPALRGRLIELYAQFGETGRAIPHATALARGSKEHDVLARPVLLALEAGRTDTALELLEQLAVEQEDPRPWREWTVALAWQDLRVDLVVSELESLRHAYPEGGYEARLEGVLRRRGMEERLVALLEERLDREPDNEALQREVLSLHAGLGHEEAVRAQLQKQVDHVADARTFFEKLDNFLALGVPDLPARARAWAESPTVRSEEVPELLARLTPHADDPDYLAAAVVLARRFPTHPASRAFLVALVDASPGDAERALAAEKLASEHPGDADYLRTWIDRASWAGAVESERRAREGLLAAEPEDLENRRELADLYSLTNRPQEALAQWRFLAAREGLESQATLRLIDALFAADRLEEAMTVLEQRASLPNTSVEDRLHVADELFGSRHFDRALRFYMAALETEPNDAHALLRVGQIRSWTNDPRGAIPFLEQRLAVSEEDVAEVRFFLGEAYWSIAEGDRARELHALALEELSARADRTLEQDVMVARMLTRFGRIEEARPLFEQCLAQMPEDTDLLLDYADAMMAGADLAKARELVDRAQKGAPDHARVMRVDGQLALLEGRFEDAAVLLQRAVDLHGADAGIESDLGRALELSGEWRRARDAYRRSLELQHDNRDVALSLQRLADQLARMMHASLEVRRAADDSVVEGWLSGSFLVGDDRTRVAAALGVSDFTGRAAAVGNGDVDVTETFARLRGAVYRRHDRNDQIAAGLEIAPGAPGDLAAGGWIGARFTRLDPYRAVGARLHFHMLLEDPAAAPGLGGRTSGATLFAHEDFLEHFWAAAELKYEQLSIRSIHVPGGGSADDPRVTGTVTLGWRVLEGLLSVADRHDLGSPEEGGLNGPWLENDPVEGEGPMVHVWLRYEGIRLLGDAELVALLPIGDQFDYVTLGTRADLHFAASWGAKAEAYAGIDLHSSESIFGIEAGLTHRPTPGTEFTALFGYGRALGRAQASDAVHFRLGFTYRW